MDAVTTRPLVVHYRRPRGDYAGWQLWAWDRATESLGGGYEPTGQDAFGAIYEVEPARHGGGPAIGLLPRRGDWWEKDGPDRVWQSHEAREVWLLEGVCSLFTAPPDTSPAVIEARLVEPDRILIRLSHPQGAWGVEPAADDCRLSGPGPAPPRIRSLATPESGNGWLNVRIVELERPLDLEADRVWEMTIGLAGYRPCPLNLDRLLDRPEFVSDDAFGALATREATTLRVFAPTASRVTAHLYAHPIGGTAERVPLRRGPRGVWQVVLPRDLNGVWYTLTAGGLDPRFDESREVIDPWARGTAGHAGRGLILRDTTPVARAPRFPPSESVVYELHLRDFTISPDSGVRARGQYLGAVEPGTHLHGDPSIATGLDHLVELGINVVQLLPVMDFENDESSPAYNWGYMPVHFNAPDGWYASTPTGPARVIELKRMVDAFHRRGIKVVLDVVFNHTAEKAPEKVYSFEALAPGYYYRHWPDGTPANGSACGNEFRSEAPMARRFLIDTMKYWVTEYRVDGFRFDLMGLIDLETLTQATRELHAIDPDLLLYGEPWAAAATPVEVTGKGRQRSRGFGIFDDGFRDAIKGGVFDATPGFIQGGERGDAIRRGLAGGIDDFADSPLETVNFAECHDNATLWDRLVVTTAARADVTSADLAAMHRLAGALVLLAQGIPFLHAGQEMLRTKGGDANSYRSPDAVNQIRWAWKRENAETVAYYRGLIALRRAHPMFRLTTADAVRRQLWWLDSVTGQHLPEGLVGFQLIRGEGADSWESACVVFNAAAEPARVELPAGEWQVYVMGARAGVAPLAGEPPVAGACRVAPRSTLVLGR